MTDSDDKTPAQEPNKAAVPDEHARSEQPPHIPPPQASKRKRLRRRKRAFLVPRVSTPQQGKPDKVSLDLQIEQMTAFCNRMDFEVCKAKPVAFSGAKEDAPHLQELRNAIEAHQVDVVCFYNHDRAFRDVFVGLGFLKLATDHGVDVYFGDHLFDPSDPDDYLATLMQLVIASHRRGQLQKAARFKHEYVRRQGRWYRPTIPVGYDFVDETGTLAPNHKAVLVAEVFHDVASTPCFLALTLEAAKRLKLDDKSLHQLIENPVYRGQILYGGELYDWDPYRIVPDDIWYQAQENLHSRRPRKRRQNLMAKLAKELGNAAILDTLLADGHIPCRSCGASVRRNGITRIRGLDVPKVRCENGHEYAIVGSHAIQDLQHLMACWDCGERRMSHFSVTHPWNLWWHIQCKTCGWKTRTLRCPFRPNPKPPPPAQNRGLSDFGVQL